MCFSSLGTGLEKVAIGGPEGSGDWGADINQPAGVLGALGGGNLQGMLGGSGGMGMLGGGGQQDQGGGPQRQQPPLFGPDAFFKFLSLMGPAMAGPNLLMNLAQQYGPQAPGIGVSPRPGPPGQ